MDKKISSWQERMEKYNDQHIVTNGDIQKAMQEEIDDLRIQINCFQKKLQKYKLKHEFLSEKVIREYEENYQEN